MKALLTGGAGFVGSHLADALLDLTARMVLSYERGEAGHGLFVFAR